jgi:hypothetical protein
MERAVQSHLFCLTPYDLKRLTVYSIAHNDPPGITLEDCDQKGEKCRSFGYLKYYTDVLDQQFNFTYESHKGDDFGVLSKSAPNNLSGEWGGVMGGVINAKYDLSISARMESVRLKI